MELKYCKSCEQELKVDQFYKQKSNKTGYQQYCKQCSVKAALKYQKDNKERVNKRIQKTNHIIRDRNFNFVKRYLQMFGKCIDCNHKDIRVLEFDHVRGNKIKGVKDMCGNTSSIKSIKDEIRKCEVRCCNCHRIKTGIDLGWKRI
jgi:hypothetical protein